MGVPGAAPAWWGGQTCCGPPAGPAQLTAPALQAGDSGRGAVLWPPPHLVPGAGCRSRVGSGCRRVSQWHVAEVGLFSHCAEGTPRPREADSLAGVPTRVSGGEWPGLAHQLQSHPLSTASWKAGPVGSACSRGRACGLLLSDREGEPLLQQLPQTPGKAAWADCALSVGLQPRGRRHLGLSWRNSLGQAQWDRWPGPATAPACPGPCPGHRPCPSCLHAQACWSTLHPRGSRTQPQRALLEHGALAHALWVPPPLSS